METRLYYFAGYDAFGMTQAFQDKLDSFNTHQRRNVVGYLKSFFGGGWRNKVNIKDRWRRPGGEVILFDHRFSVLDGRGKKVTLVLEGACRGETIALIRLF